MSNRAGRILWCAALVVVLLASGAAKGDVFTWEATPSNSNWNNALNWAGTANQYPNDFSDTAIVNGVPTNGFDPTLNLNVSIGTLTLLNNGDVSLGNFSMLVAGTTTVDGGGSLLVINDSPSFYDFDTNFLTIGTGNPSFFATVVLHGAGALLQVDNTLTINSGGVVLVVDGGEVEVGDDLDLNVGGILRGYGVIQLTGVAGDDFINDGRIQVLDGTLRIERTAGSASRFDWDGAGTNGASLNVFSYTTLDIDLPLSDTQFNGTITLNTSSTLDVATAWSLSGGGVTDQGVLNVDSSTTGTVTGSAVTLLTGSEVNVNAGTLVFAANLTANGGSTVNVATGSALQLDGTATFNATSNINPAGVWLLTVGGNTTINQTNFNWDGSGGLANVTTVGPDAFLTINSDHIDTGANDQFDATLTINSGTVDVDNLPNNWIMNGTLTMDTAAGQANLDGDSVNVWGPIAVTGGGIANISVPIRFENNPVVTVAAGTQLQLNGSATFASATASFTGNGILENNGGMQTLANTTVNMANGTFDLDGDPFSLVNLNSNLTLNVASIDNDDANLFEGTLTIQNFAKLTVNLTNPADEWTMDRTMTITGPADPLIADNIGGSDFNLTGDATISGNSSWSARVDISGTVTLNANANLRLTGGSIADPNTIAGGTISVATGTLEATTNDALFGFGTIDTAILFLNNAELRADNGTLTLGGAINDVAVIGTNDADGILDVTNAWNTNVTNLVELRGGEIRGATITNAAGQTIRGHGSIRTNQVHNEGTIAADGGTLTLDFTLAPNLDGTFVVGTLEAINGDLVIVDAMAADDPFHGTINVGPGRSINFMAGWVLGNIGVLNLDGGGGPPMCRAVRKSSGVT